ncbi:MAG TPA: hypothetical protein GXX14_10350 [Clostridiaceae bacterium]|nr:hypothetical protein [Clostridiaceae bacterium]
MKWKEVRKIYPNQFVKFKILKSHVEEDNEYIDEVAVIGPIDDNHATKELLASQKGILVYHTSKENIVLKIRSRIGLRRAIR